MFYPIYSTFCTLGGIALLGFLVHKGIEACETPRNMPRNEQRTFKIHRTGLMTIFILVILGGMYFRSVAG